MTNFDPGDPLPPDAIQRVLFIAPSVHVYAIPPLTSTKGYLAAGWTASSVHQFPPCRLRIVETSLPTSNPPSSSTSSTTSPPPPSSPPLTAPPPDPPAPLTTHLLLESLPTGSLFAACPYTHPSAVDAALDSSRFFALRVADPSGRKAVLGIGFEERSDAFDFGVALQEARKCLGMASGPGTPTTAGLGLGLGGAAAGGRRARGGAGGVGRGVGVSREGGEKRDWSLKAGQMVHVDIGRKTRSGADGGEKVGWIEPPSGGGTGSTAAMGFLPPPPSAREVRERRRVEEVEKGEKGGGLDGGFDDGEFGEFQ